MEDPVSVQHTVPHRVYRQRLTQPVADVRPSLDDWVETYRVMYSARLLDQQEAELAARGEAFFHLACTGHESMAALRPLLRAGDWFHLHYRDKALALALGVPVEQYLHNLVSNAASDSRGRQMPPFLCDASRHLLAQNIPVGNHALQAVGVAATIVDRPDLPLVICSMGDGATQQGEVLEAVAEAVRSALPVLFVVEDNRYSISTRTEGRTFYSLPGESSSANRFFGLEIQRCDGRDPVGLLEQIAPVVGAVRATRRPAIAVVRMERLSNHTNSDDERVYRPEAERLAAREGDPVARLRGWLGQSGVTADRIETVEREVQAEMVAAADRARHGLDPARCEGAKRPLSKRLRDAASEYRGEVDGPGRLTMLEAIRETLRARLASDSRVTLLGQDIEDPKGDVFGVTRGLSTAFAGRVCNAALSESTIVGTSIGRALAGERPVAFVQFADFLPLAYNQIQSELGSIYWRTAGAYECPVILMVACGGYRPGLGPFHAQTLESVMAHVPGVDVVMPATAADAAGLLQAAFESGRPTIFFYPKTSLNDRDQTTSSDVEAQFVPLGVARRARRGDDLTIVTWGSTVRHAELAAAALGEASVGVDLLDLRSLSPWDERAVCESAGRTGRLIVLHEDNRTCGFGAEVVATVAERLDGKVRVRRVTRDDTYVPYNFANQLEVLPSFRRLMNVAAELLGREIEWEVPEAAADRGQRYVVEARGPSPADEAVTVVGWGVAPGDLVQMGDRLGDMEADKAVFELVSPVAGRVLALRVAEGVQVATGTGLLEIAVDGADALPVRPVREVAAIPKLSFSTTAKRGKRSQPSDTRVGLSVPTVALGSMQVDNASLLHHFPGRVSADVIRRTGIESRCRLGPDETVLQLAVRAARGALERSGLALRDVDTLICSTGSPQMITPSMGCLILNELSRGEEPVEMPAFDVSAACSGFLYALSIAWDRLQGRPDSRILLVTAEGLSPLADPEEFETTFLFGDAATATIVQGGAVEGEPAGWLKRPLISARGEPGEVLRVPVPGNGFIKMDGLRVYAEAVRRMIDILKRACKEAGLRSDELDMVVPHQANARIIADIQRRLRIPAEKVLIQMSELGNTSSSSIPIALAELSRRGLGGKVGLTAFGGGYTFAGAVLDWDPAASKWVSEPKDPITK